MLTHPNPRRGAVKPVRSKPLRFINFLSFLTYGPPSSWYVFHSLLFNTVIFIHIMYIITKDLSSYHSISSSMSGSKDFAWLTTSQN